MTVPARPLPGCHRRMLTSRMRSTPFTDMARPDQLTGMQWLAECPVDRDEKSPSARPPYNRLKTRLPIQTPDLPGQYSGWAQMLSRISRGT